MRSVVEFASEPGQAERRLIKANPVYLRFMTTDSTQLVANDVMAHVEKLGSVNVTVEGRITKLGQ